MRLLGILDLLAEAVGRSSLASGSLAAAMAALRISDVRVPALALLLGLLLWPVSGRAQDGQLGGQARADAARNMIVLGVEQGIASLPPPSGQAFSYEYDRAHDTYVRSQRLGPTAFRAAEPVGAGHFSIRLAVSYFDLTGSFGPITYAVAPQDASLPQPRGFAQIGLDAQGRVELTNFSATYGVTNRFELTFNLPIVVVDAQASQSFTTRASARNVPAKDAVLSGAPTLEGLNAALKSGALVLRNESFSALGFDFNDGTHVGVGRISLGAKGVAYTARHLQLALSTQLFLPSPNENEFSGSASTAILPRAVAAVPITSLLKLRMDAGYDYDFDVAELRAFVWDAGASVPMRRASFDLGVGGSDYNKAIVWTPPVVYGAKTTQFPATVLTAQNDTRLGDTFVDFLGGMKFRVTDRLVLSGAVNVPLNNQGFRPAALGTLALESYF